MADTCHNATGLPALQQHCGEVQSVAVQLVGIMQAIEMLDDENIGRNAVSSLIRLALTLAEQITSDLDCVNLPKGGAA